MCYDTSGDIMKNSTKEKILETARTLFNEEGYQNITMRRIADELHISVGNLTYHFKHKKDILEALIHNLEFLEKEKPAQSCLDLNDQLRKMIQSLIEERFFFISDELANLDPEFAEKNRRNVAQIKNILLEILAELTELKLFNPEFDQTAREAWTKIIMLAHLSWAKSLDLKKDPQKQADEFLADHWILLMPYLSEKGIAQIKEMFSRN